MGYFQSATHSTSFIDLEPTTSWNNLNCGLWLGQKRRGKKLDWQKHWRLPRPLTLPFGRGPTATCCNSISLSGTPGFFLSLFYRHWEQIMRNTGKCFCRRGPCYLSLLGQLDGTVEGMWAPHQRFIQFVKHSLYTRATSVYAWACILGACICLTFVLFCRSLTRNMTALKRLLGLEDFKVEQTSIMVKRRCKCVLWDVGGIILERPGPINKCSP